VLGKGRPSLALLNGMRPDLGLFRDIRCAKAKRGRAGSSPPHSIRQPGCSGCKKKGAAAGTPAAAVAAPAAVFLFVSPRLLISGADTWKRSRG
jgi:hypothetical protein